MSTEVMARARRETRLHLGVLITVSVGALFLLGSLLHIEGQRSDLRQRLGQVTSYQTNLSQLAELLRDLETGQRGFLLTGREVFLDPYRRAQVELAGVASVVRTQAAAVGSEAIEYTAALWDAAERWQQSAGRTLDLRRSGEPPSVETVAAGKALFDAVRERQRVIEDHTRARAGALREQLAHTAERTQLLLELLLAALLTLAVSSVWTVAQTGQRGLIMLKRQARAQAYSRVVSSLNGPTQMATLLREALPPILDTAEAQAAVVYLREPSADGDPRKDRLVPAAASGVALAAVAPLVRGQGRPWAALEQGHALAERDLPADGPLQLDLGVGSAPPRTVLNLPLRFGPLEVGVLTVASLGAVSPEDQAQLVLAAFQLSTAVNQVRAFEELAQKQAELQQKSDESQRRAQELEEKNQEVERANRLKSEFVANMSHELRTPLNSILALSQILLEELDGALNPEQRKQVGIIERNGQNLLRLINDVLDLSKIEAGKLELVATRFPARELIEAAELTMGPLVAQKGIRLVVDVAQDLGALYQDENKLKQILLNLLSNAVKFTDHGQVTLSARRGPPDGWVTFQVADTGIGIAAADLPMIWEEFRQLDGSLARRFEGTGLGLAIVRRLVGLIGGHIEVTSQLGHGTTFTVSVPAELSGAVEAGQRSGPMALAAPRELLDAPTGDGRPLVLTADDDPEVIYILDRYLQDAGFAVEPAYSGEEAIAKARALQPYAITLDVMMPHMDGWEVIQVLKSDPRTEHIPIVVVSMLDNRQLGFSLGAADYLVKPVLKRELLERLSRLRGAGGGELRCALVLDDDPIERRVVSMLLGEAGLEVTACASGPEALQWLTGHTPDLITMDLMMPGMDGFAVLEEIRKNPLLAEVPVLIMTAKSITAEDRKRMNGHIAALIQKGPRERARLLEELARLLHQHGGRPGSGVAHA